MKKDLTVKFRRSGFSSAGGAVYLLTGMTNREHISVPEAGTNLIHYRVGDLVGSSVVDYICGHKDFEVIIYEGVA